MAISGAILITGGVFPVDMGFKFEPTVPPGITVPEWYLTGLYAFLRTQYDKFVTGVLWPGLFILALLIVPFIDRYKKFSWKDRPLITAFGITGIAQIMVTTYWGFYISPDTAMPLVERLVIDPILFYTVMILLVPLGFGFSYMMIKMSKEAERKAKLAASKGPQKVAQIHLSAKWINWLIIALLGFQVYLNIAAYNAALSGMNNFNLFLTGVITLVFAGLFHIYRYGMNEAKKIPAPPHAIEKEISKPIGVSPPSDTSKLPEKDKSLPVAESKQVAPEIKSVSTTSSVNEVSSTTDFKKP